MRYLLVAMGMAWVGWMIGHQQGIVEGRSMALKLNPVSPELELTCAVLWIGEQNKKYMEKK